MKAGNAEYLAVLDFPDVIPVFPLAGALLLPGGNLPLNIFEPRYLAMTEHALATDRLIGMIQPDPASNPGDARPALCKMGCIGRLTAFQESGDGRYAINLTGICRFSIEKEEPPLNGFRQVRFTISESDLDFGGGDETVKLDDREGLIDTLRKYLAANGMDANWEAVEQTDDEMLVTALCMMSPYGPAEKQALLEADDLNTRAETLIAITEIAMARDGGSTAIQ
ncbi:LON peptidase substrate-binding domain-containing protein [Salaquimonas pukyongi]|uniref:LON peptidase substrate-binding domain-containing protein n=1 Tax=Salaquimonas pukyongi TaxID=2712698 RepID=UPI00096B7157|nr:LON peptidase substrate-binding domain-containing protein [Salaquimonas pukyongi]